MGTVVKCIVQYDRPFWREEGYSGEAITDGLPVRATFDGCSPDGSFHGLVAFVIADAARGFGELAAEERQQRVAEHLAELFGPAAAKPKDYIDMVWASERWSAGCYVGVAGPRVLTDCGHALRKPLHRVHFAGTEAATRWCGYFDGALEAGQRAAADVERQVER